MEFLSDITWSSRRFRIFAVVDDFTLAWTVRSTPGHGSARLLPWRLSLTRLTEDQLSDPKGDLNVLSPASG